MSLRVPAHPLALPSTRESRWCLRVLSTIPGQPRGWLCSGSACPPWRVWVLLLPAQKPPQPSQTGFASALESSASAQRVL